ncbi:Uncharacterized protein TCM_012276 [Theobroma cacao]|uniref:Uncharacterized protein n=1 Tax=Theobroma cacao TaxID=3641 RepID=A0A061FTZ9_THECC|nr:Uncharacterized protein TCM_012276 [Theobroma cacao]
MLGAEFSAGSENAEFAMSIQAKATYPYKGASVMKTLIGNTDTPSKVCPFPRVNVAVKRRSSVPVRTVVIHGLAPCVSICSSHHSQQKQTTNTPRLIAEREAMAMASLK